MKRFVLLLSAVFSLFISYSQNASLNFNIKDKCFDSNKKDLYFVQNNCNNNVKFIVLNFIDWFPCRTDSIFKTDNYDVFIFNSYDQENNLRYEGNIHLHIKYSAKNPPDLNLLSTVTYQDSLSVESVHYIDNNGAEVLRLCCCDWVLETFEIYRTDINETIYDSEMIRRMAW